jgi:hypothetical protein
VRYVDYCSLWLWQVCWPHWSVSLSLSVSSWEGNLLSYQNYQPYFTLLTGIDKQYYSHIVTKGIHNRILQFQKLMKHLFRTLHGHNILCQQRCPSFSCAARSSLLMLTVGPRDQFPRWRRRRRRLPACSVIMCPSLWIQCSVSFVQGLKKTHHTRIISF